MAAAAAVVAVGEGTGEARGGHLGSAAAGGSKRAEGKQGSDAGLQLQPCPCLCNCQVLHVYASAACEVQLTKNGNRGRLAAGLMPPPPPPPLSSAAATMSLSQALTSPQLQGSSYWARLQSADRLPGASVRPTIAPLSTNRLPARPRPQARCMDKNRGCCSQCADLDGLSWAAAARRRHHPPPFAPLWLDRPVHLPLPPAS